MASIDFQDVCMDFPIYNVNGRSLKKRLMQVATGGQVGADPQGRVIVRALEKLNFTLKDGDRLALLGHNGAGKSTLLRLLSGVYEPSSGRAEIQGHIGSLIDISLGIDPELTGRENIYLRGALLGVSRANITKQVEEIIDFSELGEFVDMPLRTYSTGMHLRLAFAVSTIVRPEILLLDEWLSVGDEGFKHKAEERMNDLVQSTRILVVATHSRDLALKSCNRAIILEHGKIVLDTTPDEACRVYFGE